MNDTLPKKNEIAFGEQTATPDRRKIRLPVSPSVRNMRKTLKLILIILFLFAALPITYDSRPRTHISYFAPGPIQAIGNKNTLWVFLEFSRIVHHPRVGPTCTWDYPSVYPEGNFQEVLVLDRTGLIDRIRVSIDNGISFNPNLGDIYIDNDRIYLHSPPSMNYRRSIFEWKTDHFELLSLKVSEQIFAKMGMKENNIESFRRSLEAFDEVTARNDWKKVFEDFKSVDSQFVWEDCEIRIERSGGNKEFLEITLQLSSAKKENAPIILKYERQYEEYKGKKKRSSQEGHPK